MRHQSTRRQQRKGGRRMMAAAGAIVAAAVIAGGVILFNNSAHHDPGKPLPVNLPTTPNSYLGVFVKGVPTSYSPVTRFASATGAKPDVVMYYSGWYMPFPAKFATTAASNGVVPLVQIDPDGINIRRIAAGHYDGYLSQYAESVRAYHHPVVMSFGHEMNGDWYSWGYKKTTPAAFVAAWRHIVTLFRTLGARNVTWLWTVNIINDTQHGKIPRPNQWWPGSAYVTWVGIDGYYLKPTWKFAPLFGPTIAAVRTFTGAPILIAETGAVPAAGQPGKINDLFAGIRSYGLLGFVYFDTTNSTGEQFGIESPAAISALRKGASSYQRPS